MSRLSTYSVLRVDTITPRVECRPRISLWLLRTVFTVHLVLVLVQPVLAGLYLTGDIDAISVHAANGDLLIAVNLLVIASTIGYVVAGRGRIWAIPVAVVLFLAIGLQVGFGWSRELQLHVPLGVAIITASVLLAIWVWSPSAARPRGAR
jgi:hypothetical protein